MNALCKLSYNQYENSRARRDLVDTHRLTFAIKNTQSHMSFTFQYEKCWMHEFHDVISSVTATHYRCETWLKNFMFYLQDDIPS